jgi:hypothetical protein
MEAESIPEPPSLTFSQQTKRHISLCLYLNGMNEEGEGGEEMCFEGRRVH